MQKISCTVGILTFNSATTLRDALESVREFDDIVICDGGSTDATRAIAHEYGCRVIDQASEFKNRNGTLADYAAVRNQCLDAAQHDWFLYIDSDEVATPELVAEVRKIVESPVNYSVYNVSPRIVLDGVLIEHSSNYPGWQQRFFRRSTGARFRKPVHERITYDRTLYPAGFLSAHWHYFLSRKRAIDPEKNEKYARMDAALYAQADIFSLARQSMVKLITALKVLLKGLYNRVRYGAQSTMPLELEWVRARYHLYIFALLWTTRLGMKNV